MKMKKTIALLVILASVTFAYSQKLSEKNIPSPVKSALKKRYPNLKALTWEKEDDNYEAGFEVAEEDYSVLIDPTGTILETEVEIDMAKVPTDAKTYIAKHYTGKKIKETAKITDNKGVVTYEVEIKGKNLIFDANGRFLKEID